MYQITDSDPDLDPDPALFVSVVDPDPVGSDFFAEPSFRIQIPPDQK